MGLAILQKLPVLHVVSDNFPFLASRPVRKVRGVGLVNPLSLIEVRVNAKIGLFS